ncbi:MAG: xanthine dehydrogenase family protein molybdopterin-binding subunit [Hyphomicrobiales bacterium]|nr:xanthine dehydrogenase family protein molybdopterin-binding subunit [Hyphomicrobiales bacterium]
MTDQGIGAAVLRREDGRFITGKGRFVDDISRPGQAYACFLRSPHAHAEIRKVDVAKAAKSAGVIVVLTGKEVAADGLGGMPCGWGITNSDGTKMVEPAWPILAQGRVRFVGDMVAVVVAESLAAARDGAEVIEVDYKALPAAASTATAMRAGTPQIWDAAKNNVCFDWDLGDAAATDAAIDASAHVTKLDIVNQRVVASAIEPRAALAEYDAANNQLTLHCTSQAPHVARLLLGAFVLNHPEHKFRVVSPDVGGGFGSKIYPYVEYAVLCWAAKRLGRPIKWTAQRSESFLSDAHGRDHVTVAELGLDKDGGFTALRVSTIANLGAYLSTFGPLIPTYLYAPLFAGQYTTPAIHVRVQAVFTNTVPVDAVRGAGRPEATFLLERLVETAARELGMDPGELRRRNFIKPDAYPYQTPVAFVYDSGDYAAALDKALEIADYKGFAKRREEAKKRGKLRGIGLSTPIEATGAAPSAIAGALGARAGLYESAEVRFNPTGSVTVYLGVHSHGQGHATTFAQIVASKLGVPYDNVEIVEGDTGAIPFGMGTYGSRSASVGGSAVIKACDKIIAKGKKIAAHLLEASEGDIGFEDGSFKVSGTDKAKSIGEVAFAAYVPHNYPLETLEPGLDEQAFFDPTNFNFPYAAYVCEVEVDPDTGVTEIVKFTAVDDVGNVINPMIVHGQVQGGVVHGIGQALTEQSVYDASGQLVTGSYMDYCLPRADNVPMIDCDLTVTPCPSNPLGVKGVGEIGAIGAPPAVINAITDAIGNNDLSMPATAEKVWQAIRAA